jgi:hypothetical protein
VSDPGNPFGSAFGASRPFGQVVANAPSPNPQQPFAAGDNLLGQAVRHQALRRELFSGLWIKIVVLFRRFRFRDGANPTARRRARRGSFKVAAGLLPSDLQIPYSLKEFLIALRLDRELAQQPRRHDLQGSADNHILGIHPPPVGDVKFGSTFATEFPARID